MKRSGKNTKLMTPGQPIKQSNQHRERLSERQKLKSLVVRYKNVTIIAKNSTQFLIA